MASTGDLSDGCIFVSHATLKHAVSALADAIMSNATEEHWRSLTCVEATAVKEVLLAGNRIDAACRIMTLHGDDGHGHDWEPPDPLGGD